MISFWTENDRESWALFVKISAHQRHEISIKISKKKKFQRLNFRLYFGKIQIILDADVNFSNRCVDIYVIHEYVLFRRCMFSVCQFLFLVFITWTSFRLLALHFSDTQMAICNYLCIVDMTTVMRWCAHMQNERFFCCAYSFEVSVISHRIYDDFNFILYFFFGSLPRKMRSMKKEAHTHTHKIDVWCFCCTQYTYR